MARRAVPVSVIFTGNTADLEAAYLRAATGAEEASNKMVYSSRSAAQAAIDEAQKANASADETVKAAVRGAEAYQEAAGKISTTAMSVGTALADEAKKAQLSADEVSAAYDEGVAATVRYETAQKALIDAQKASAAAAADQAASQDAARSKLSGIGERTAGMAKEISKFGGIGFAASIAGMGDMAAKFQTATQQISANADISSQAAMRVGKAFLSTSGESIFSAKDMAGAFAPVAGQLKNVEGHALSAAQSLRVMNAASDLAEATNTSLASSTAALATVMQAYRTPVAGAAQASDTLFNVSRALNMPLDAVAQAVNKLHGRFGNLAPSLSEVGGLMVDLGSHGIQGGRGIQVASTAMQTLIGGSQQTDEVLQALGVHVFGANGKFVGLQNVIAQLQPRMAALSQQQQDLAAKTLFGSSAAQVMLQVIQQGPDAFAKQVDAARKLGTAHRAAQEQTQTLGKQLDILKASVENAATSVGLKLLPGLTSMVKGLQDAIKWLERHKAATEDAAIAIGTVLAGAVAVFAFEKAQNFVQGVGKMFSAVTALGSGVKKMASMITGQFASTEAGVAASESEMVATTDASATAMDTAIGSTGIGLLLIGLGIAATELAAHWKTAWDAIKEVTQTVANFVIGLINNMVGLFNSSIGKITGDIGKLHSVNLTGGGQDKSSVGTGQDLSPAALRAAKSANMSGFTASEKVTAQAVVSSLMGMGLSRAGASAIAGNWTQESGLNPSLNETDSMGRGFGMASWATAGGIAGEQQFAKSHNLPWNSVSAQTGFTMQELQSQPGLLAALKSGSGGASQLALAFSQQFERPSAEYANNANREKYAEEIFSALHGGATKPTANGFGKFKMPKMPKDLTGKINLGNLTAATSPAVKSGESMLSTFQSAVENGSLTTLRALFTSGEGMKFNQQVSSLRGAGDNSLANNLVAVHKQAAQTLHQALLANITQYHGEILSEQAQEIQDRAQSAQRLGQDQLNVVKAMQQKVNDASASVVTNMKNAAQSAADQSAGVVTKMKDMQQKVDDMAAMNTQRIADMTQTMTDQVAGMVKAVQDAASVSSAQSQSIVDAINDTTQIQTDTLAERGLYGLNLVAQQQKVTADQIKAGFDQQIDALQTQLATLQQQADVAESAAQVHLDQVTATQHGNVSLAQIHLNQVTMVQDQKTAKALNHEDAVTASSDRKVNRALAHLDQVTAQQDRRLSRAQQHADDVQLHMDTSKVGPAQIAVDMHANASQTVQALMNARLRQAQGAAGVAEGAAQLNVNNVQNSVNKQIQAATSAYNDVQNAANKAIQQATSNYTAVQDTANQKIQAATDAYDKAQNTMNRQIQNATTNLANVTNYYNASIAKLQSTITGVQNQAAQKEGAANSTQSITAEEASTQFAGSGLTVNVFGAATGSPEAIGSEVSWAVRTAGIQTT